MHIIVHAADHRRQSSCSILLVDDLLVREMNFFIFETVARRLVLFIYLFMSKTDFN